MKIKTVFILILVLSIAVPCWAKDVVYMSKAEALKWAFPKSEVETVLIELTREQATEIEAQTEAQIYDSDKTIYIGKKAEKVVGYAVITNEIGKFEPITFIVKLTPKLSVEKIAVMVYRESRGGEISRKRFQGQYKGKKKTDPLMINRDIINITGATMSVRSVNRGIRKVFALMDHYLQHAS